MINIKNFLYERFGNFDFFEKVKGMNFDFMIEAGVHDGSDSETFLETFPEKSLFGFEPDPVAYELASARLLKYGRRAKITKMALSDHVGEVSLVKSGTWGSGSTSVEPASKKSELIRCDRLENVTDPKGNGILWLDVEGHAVNVLSGAKNVLKSIVAAKIEVQMHDMYGLRKRDAWQVIKILEPYELLPLKLPIYPGFFGDILFIHSNFCSPDQKFYSKFAKIIFFLLHRVLFPLFRKPKNKW